MKYQEVTFNADNWVDGVVRLEYREFEDGTIKFAYRGEKWVLSPVVVTEESTWLGSEYDLFQSKLYRESRTVTEFPTVKMMKFRKDNYWTATDDDYLNGINREHANRLIAACQILGNIT